LVASPKLSEKKDVLSPTLEKKKILSPLTDKKKKDEKKEVTSPNLEDRKSGSAVKKMLLKSKSKESLKDSGVSKKGDDDFVRLERYDVLLDDELPELPSVPPPISNKAEYKQYMVLRYEYERRGLLGDSDPVPAALSPKSERKPSEKPVEEEVRPVEKSSVLSGVDDFDPSMAEAFDEDLAAHLTEVQVKPVVEEKKKQPVKKVAPKVEKKVPELRYKVGDKVESLWEDGIWYASTVSQLDLESPGGPFFLVVFDDFGNDQVCVGSQLRLRSSERIFNVGDICECKWVEDETFYRAQVLDAGTLSGQV
jgi:hypothetical protein